MKIPFTPLEIHFNGYTQRYEIRNNNYIRIDIYDQHKHGVQEDYSLLRLEPKWEDIFEGELRMCVVSYYDDEGEGTTEIYADHEITEQEAAEILKEQLEANNIFAGEITITELRRITSN